MFAVFKTGGKQYRVAAEDMLQVDKVKGEPGEIVEFGEVLVLGGDSVTLGAPTVAGATVAAEVIEQGRGAENHRVQEAPAEEFAAQVRPSSGIHAASHYRNPDGRQKAEQRGPAAKEIGAEACCGAGCDRGTASEGEPQGAKGKAAKSGTAAAKKPSKPKAKARVRAKKPATKGKKK